MQNTVKCACEADHPRLLNLGERCLPRAKTLDCSVNHVRLCNDIIAYSMWACITYLWICSAASVHCPRLTDGLECVLICINKLLEGRVSTVCLEVFSGFVKSLFVIPCESHGVSLNLTSLYYRGSGGNLACCSVSSSKVWCFEDPVNADPVFKVIYKTFTNHKLCGTACDKAGTTSSLYKPPCLGSNRKISNRDPVRIDLINHWFL